MVKKEIKQLLRKLWIMAWLMLWVTSYGLVPNPYKKYWQCHPIKKKWVCAEILQNLPTLTQGSLGKRRQFKQVVSEQLGWIQNTSETKNKCQICQGHYYIEKLPPNPENKGLKSAKTKIEHVEKSEGNLAGYVRLKGPVKITQPSRILYADDVTLRQNKKTKRLQFIDAKGHLRLHQPTSLLIAEKGKADLATHSAQLVHSHYLYKVSAIPGSKSIDHNFLGYAHGHANTINQLNKKTLTLDNATYSTCSPLEDTWLLKAKHLNLNKATGRGHAYNMVLKVQRIPIFYTPFFSFPLDNRRYSGFLYPLLGLNSKNQTWLALPYYFNLAPNLDDTLYPISYFAPSAPLQAEVLHNQFRYLFGFKTPITIQTHGNINVDALVYQKTLPPFLAMTNNVPVKQGFNTAVFTNETKFGSHLTTGLTYQYIRDQAFLNVYPNDFNGFSKDVTSAERSFSAQYAASYWNATLLMQDDRYFKKQTLSDLPILTRANQTPAVLPQLDVTISPPSPAWVKLTLTGQFLNIVKLADKTHNRTFTQGIRYHLGPALQLPITPSYGFFTPEVSLFSSFYALRNIDNTLPQENPSATLAVPVMDVHTGLYFDRRFRLGNTHYQQTVEPELFYLYVPYQDQYHVPVLADTAYTSFSAASLLSKNRFVGFDRIGDANQLSAVMSTTISNDVGNQLTLGMGEIFYFKDRLVSMTCQQGDTACLLRENPDYQQKHSPIVGFLTYDFNQDMSLHGDLTYNTRANNIDTQNYSFTYHADHSHVINIGYSDQVNDALLTPEQRLKGDTGTKQALLTFSSIWEVAAPWSVISSASYSIDGHRVIDVLAGLKYDSCCWSMQIFSEGGISGIDPNTPADYVTGAWDRRYVLSISLKGLGGVDQSEVNELLSRIPGSGVTSTPAT